MIVLRGKNKIGDGWEKNIWVLIYMVSWLQ